MPATPRPNPVRKELPRRRIVRSRCFFDAAFTGGKALRISSRFFTLLVLNREERENSDREEVAFLVPKRLGSAHFRNRLRRRMREVYRLHFTPELRRRLLWMAKAPAAALDFQALLADMKEVHARSL